MSNPNPNPAGRFKPGDPRIWKGGRPKSFDALRELAQEIAHEKARSKDGQAIVVDGHSLTIAEMVLRRWAASADFRQQQAFIEVAFGKTPTVLTGPDGRDIFPVADIIAAFQKAGETDGSPDSAD